MAGIFISYRQADAKAWAIGLRNDLAKSFGEDKVFLDKEALGPGNWRDQIQRALDRCNVVLIVIGPRWLTIVDEQNRPRLTLPEDVHRQEIALALSHQGTTVIPILFDDAVMPKAEQLPDDIRSLADQQAYKVGDTKARRKADLEVLVKGIEAVGGLSAREPPGDSGDKPSWLRPDPPSVIGAVALTLILAILEKQSGGEFNGNEITVLLVVSYALVLGGKRLWRLISNRRRSVA